MFYTCLYIVALVFTAPTLIKPPKVVVKPPVYYCPPPNPPPPPPIYIWLGNRGNNNWNEPTEDYDGDSS